MSDKCNHDLPISHEEDARIAANALDEEDFSHALFHIGWALHARPAEPAYLDLFHQLLDSVEDPLALTALEGEQVSIAHAAAHAFVLFREGQIDNAVGLIAQCVQSGEGFGYMHWISLWFSAIPTHAEAITAGPLLYLANAIASCAPGDRIRDEGVFEAVSAAAPTLARLASELEDATLMSMTANILRKVGLHDEAIALASVGHERAPTGMSASILAMVHSSHGDQDAAIAMYEVAVELDPSFTGAMLDLGDRFSQRGDFKRAISWYMRALEMDSESTWAQTHILLNRYLDDPANQGDTLADLLSLAEQGYPNAAQAYHSLGEHLGYRARVPMPRDASVNVLHHLLTSGEEHSSTVEIGVSSLEPPSVYRVFEQCGIELGAISSSVPTPDPREVVGQPTRRLWSYDGERARALVDMPAQQVVDEVSGLAGTLYYLPLWRERARSFEHADTPDMIDQLLGAMLHLSSPPEGIPPWLWLSLLQFSAVSCISVIGESDPWDRSTRRAVLLDLLHGPLDWSTGAVVTVLGEIALEFEEGSSPREEIFKELLATRARIPEVGFECCVYPLHEALARFPELDETTRAEIEEAAREQ